MYKSRISRRVSVLALLSVAGLASAQVNRNVDEQTKKSQQAQAATAASQPQEMSTEYVIDWEASKEDAAEELSMGERHAAVRVKEGIAGPEADERSSNGEDASSPNQTVKVSLFKIKNWPEFKVENKEQCRRIFGHRVCVNVPQAFQRNCELTAFAEITHPNANSVQQKIENCCRQGVAAGVLASIYTGNLSAGAAALKTYLTACLAAVGVDHLDHLSVKVRTETTCGSWKPR